VCTLQGKYFCMGKACIGWMLITWSSKRAFIPIFFLPRESKKLSTDIGSNRASGPSSEIGGTVSGCKYNLGEKICMRNRKEIFRFLNRTYEKYLHRQTNGLLQSAVYQWKRTPNHHQAINQAKKVRNNKVQNQHPRANFLNLYKRASMKLNWESEINIKCAIHSLNWTAIQAAVIRDETEINQQFNLFLSFFPYPN